MSNMAYSSQHIDIKILHGFWVHVIVLNALRNKFNLDIESTDKTGSIVNNAGMVMRKKY